MQLDIKNITKYLVFFLLLFYQLQGIFFDSGLMIFKIILGLLMLIEVICFLFSFKDIRKNIVNGLFLLVLLNVSYYLFSDKQFFVSASVVGGGFGLNSFETWTYLKGVLYNLLFFFVVYYLTYNKYILEKEMKIFFYVFFTIAILNYFAEANNTRNELNLSEFTNNAGYGFVHLLPFIFLIDRKNIANVFLFISLGFIMFAAKRGAIIIGALFTLFYLYNQYIKNSGNNFIRNIIISLILLLMASILVYNIYLNSDYLQYRMEQTMEGNSSGRNYFYAQMWNKWSNPTNSLWNYLFGFGFASSVKITGLFAHNDWLELLTMSGIFGIIIYIIFFIQLIKYSRNKYLSKKDKNIILSILLIWFLKTLFSWGYNDSGMVSILILLGYITGKYKILEYKYVNIKNFN